MSVETSLPTERLISVVIPLYNKVGSVQRALRSVLSQTSQDFEIVVVNDGSTDGSEKAVAEVTDPRIRLIHRERVNSWGGHAARNLGIENARNELIALLDADDEWLPEHLATIRRLAGRHPECGAYGTTLARIGAHGEVVRYPFQSIPGPPWEGVLSNYFRSALEGWPLNSTTVCIPRRVFEEVGLFPLGERHGGDLDMWCRIARRYPIGYSSYVGGIYHCDSPNRIAHSIDTDYCYRSLFKTIESMLSANDFPPGVTGEDLVNFRNKHLLTLAAILAGKGRRLTAMRLVWSMERTPWSTRQIRKWYVYRLPPGWVLRAGSCVKRLLRVGGGNGPSS